MPLLDVWNTVWNDGIWWALKEVYSANEDPAWISFALMALVGAGGLAALALLYPFGRD